MEQAVTELRAQFGEDMISTDEEDLKLHGYSEWSSINIDRLPTAVAYPRSTSEVSAIAKLCTHYKIPMIPFSGKSFCSRSWAASNTATGGSSLEAHFSAPHGGISIDFNHMDQIIELHEDDLDVVLQPGVSWTALNDQLQPTGLFLPVDPGPTARIGGMVGTSCSGTNAVRYGTMKDWVVNLTVVLADGTVIKTRRRPRKTSAGYNLTNLFIGSEGTLGIVTEITLRLAVIPAYTSVATVAFPSVRRAAEAAAKVMRTGVAIAAMELMDEEQMRTINQTKATRKVWKELPTMFFKFSGTKRGVDEDVSIVKGITRSFEGSDFEFASTAEDQYTLWSARKEALWSMHAMRADNEELWSTDVAVPLSRLADIIGRCMLALCDLETAADSQIESSRMDLDQAGLSGSILGHVGDGNFHESIIFDPSDTSKKGVVKRILDKMVEDALRMDGTCTGEHGVGLGKRDKLVEELGAETIGVMQSLKFALDPHWLMNPAKIFSHPACRESYGH